MGLDIDKFNAMIAEASKIVSCDADCQRTKRKEMLKQRFIEARANVLTAPDQLNLATTQYFAFSNGKTMYEAITTDELAKKAKLLSAEIASNYLSEVDETTNSLRDYSSALTDAKFANEYNKELVQKIVQMQNTLYNAINGSVTNNRKSYYEIETTDNLRKWNYIFTIIFAVLVIALALSFVLVPNTNSTGKKIFICVALVTYPFYILYIAKFLGRIYNAILNVLPKNVYKDI